jgi:hypothetical protein
MHLDELNCFSVEELTRLRHQRKVPKAENEGLRHRVVPQHTLELKSPKNAKLGRGYEQRTHSKAKARLSMIMRMKTGRSWAVRFVNRPAGT